MRRGAGFAPASSSHGRTFRSLDLFLRLTVIPLSAASLWVMATNKQANDAYGKVEFSNITGLKYLVCTNAISLGYAAASILLSFLGCFDSDWLFFILDQVFAYLMVTSGSAATEVMYLAYQGDTEASWSEGCSYYAKFCSKGKASLFLHFAAFVCFVALSLLSAYEVFSKYEAPPLSSSKDVGDQAG